MKTKISVVSYKRPDNNTCKMLKETDLDWNVFVYGFDPFLEKYLDSYGNHVRIITQAEINKASLPKKRQLVLDEAIKLGYDYCIMMDDDIYQMKDLQLDKDLTITDFIDILQTFSYNNKEYVALSACYNQGDNVAINDYKNICNNSIFNLSLLKSSEVTYNDKSRCEDMEFAIDLMLKGYKTGRLEFLLGKNQLQGGTTDDGLSYRFENTNRFIEEGTYMQNRYPELKDVFEFDENHFKMNTNKLKNCLQIKE